MNKKNIENTHSHNNGYYKHQIQIVMISPVPKIFKYYFII